MLLLSAMPRHSSNPIWLRNIPFFEQKLDDWSNQHRNNDEDNDDPTLARSEPSRDILAPSSTQKVRSSHALAASELVHA